MLFPLPAALTPEEIAALLAPIDGPPAEAIFDDIKESIRLENLSREELVNEILETDLADNRYVVELLNRVWPEWWTE